MAKLVTHSVVVVVLLAAVAAGSDNNTRLDNNARLNNDSSKRPWQWSLEDRLTRRADPDHSNRRLQTAKTSERVRPAVGGRYMRAVDVIDGAVHPELYLPHELFEGLIRRGFVDPEWRTNYDPRAAGLPADFWSQLEGVAAAYIEDLRRERQLLEEARRADVTRRERIDAEIAAMSATTCAHRADALTRARGAFGTSLDRFLYDVIAREKITVYAEPHDRQRLTFEARGCK